MSARCECGAPNCLDISIGGLGAGRKKPYQELLSLARAEGWHVERFEELLAEMADELHRQLDRCAQLMVDKDRAVRAALLRAEDCEAHGEAIRFEGHQAYWFSRLAEAHDEERVAYVGALFALTEAMKANPDWPGADAVAKFVADAHRAGDRARKRFAAPTLADCQRAGKCEHPAPEPHAACVQLALYEEAA